MASFFFLFFCILLAFTCILCGPFRNQTPRFHCIYFSGSEQRLSISHWHCEMLCMLWLGCRETAMSCVFWTWTYKKKKIGTFWYL